MATDLERYNPLAIDDDFNCICHYVVRRSESCSFVNKDGTHWTQKEMNEWASLRTDPPKPWDEYTLEQQANIEKYDAEHRERIEKLYQQIEEKDRLDGTSTDIWIPWRPSKQNAIHLMDKRNKSFIHRMKQWFKKL